MRNISHLAWLLAGLALPALAAAGQAPSAAGNAPAAIEGVPGPLTWQNPPALWKIDNGQTLSITGGKQTDWFVDPMKGFLRDSSPRLLFRPAADFVLSAKLTVGFRTQWDGGALVLYANDQLWAKFAYEMTIYKRPTIVSVVTRDRSDDNNSISFSGQSVYLKVAKAGDAIFFYASEDGQNWTIIRAFTLGAVPNLRIGFSSQSPVGDDCTTVFSQIQYLPKKVDLWTGK